MAFRLKSQGSSFKQLGSSPAKNMKTGDYNQSFESPVKQYEKPQDKKKISPGQYWYKINNKAATKAQYMAYKNKPGGDEPGKQTNDPNVSLAKQSGNKRK
mgnify:CR=1 FL=1|tara:strand:+ start:78 stop:377 length:300 start_codon:yes stop_codon:yes gene_type:complete